ncbi:LAME_0F07844g1_1 [Lachancea meyersii CBS 8951]|uniref:LAME_0F07844g1_1 n=1 Tax=Lachancea meyersii CBS 8951 TaxID=1266667 RepID=A0A1G4JUB1_9SACH|nr:LAME_0F07844g1_1 [Lachancea meyersii CBS 8951]
MQKQLQAVPPEEEASLAYFLEVRSFLSRLKQNRTQYLNSRDVLTSYQQVLTKVCELDAIRKAAHNIPADSTTTLIHNVKLHNRVDSVLDDVFQLLSLSFLTVGLKNSAPATYASLSTVQRLLEHLDESNVFTHHDLGPIKERLDEISKIVTRSSCVPETNGSDSSIDLTKLAAEEDRNKIEQDLLLRAKLKHCLQEYEHIESKLEEIDSGLQGTMEKLFQLRRGLLSLAASAKRGRQPTTGDPKGAGAPVSQECVKQKLHALEAELTEIESRRDASGKFISSETGEVAERGQNVLNGLLDDCHDLIHDLSHHANNLVSLDSNLQPIYDNLIDIKTTLENLLVTRRWTLRETDLFGYQKRLSEIDKLRVGGKFPTDSSETKGQAILLYLLRRCYAIVYKLLECSEPVSEALQKIHNQLSTVRRCLLELKRMGGVENDRELYPYQMKLASLDNVREDGKFYDSEGNIPEGQGTLNALLAECFDILHELKIEAEERNGSESDVDDVATEETAEHSSTSGKASRRADSPLRATRTSSSSAAKGKPQAKYLDAAKPGLHYDDLDADDHDDEDEGYSANYSEHSYEDDEDDYATTSHAED